MSETTAPEGSDFYYAALYLEPSRRSAVYALETLRRELLAIPEQCSDPGIAHVKLAWWRDELSALGQATARHPLSVRLAPLAARDAALGEAYVDLVDGIIAAQQPRRFHSRDAVVDFITTLHAGTVDALSRHAAPASPAAREDRLQLAALTELGQALCNLRQHRHATAPFVASAQLSAHGLDLEALRSASDSRALRAFLDAEITFAHDAIGTRLAAMPSAQRRAERLLVTLARITAKTLALTLSDGCKLLEQRVAPTPLHKLWLAWRTARLG